MFWATITIPVLLLCLSTCAIPAALLPELGEIRLIWATTRAGVVVVPVVLADVPVDDGVVAARLLLEPPLTSRITTTITAIAAPATSTSAPPRRELGR